MNISIARLSIVAVAASVIFAGTSAITAHAQDQASPLLFPLSERDLSSASGSGCQLSFDAGGRAYIYAIGNELMIRTGAGRAVCPISNRQFAALSEGGSHSCRGTSLTIRQSGGVDVQEASDSSSAPATLTVTNRGRSWTVSGNWGTAC